jgi:hypothetical protein
LEVIFLVLARNGQRMPLEALIKTVCFRADILKQSLLNMKEECSITQEETVRHCPRRVGLFGLVFMVTAVTEKDVLL